MPTEFLEEEITDQEDEQTSSYNLKGGEQSIQDKRKVS